MGAHGRVLGLEVNDQAPYGRRKAAELGAFGREQRVHALRLEARDLAVEVLLEEPVCPSRSKTGTPKSVVGLISS